MAKIPKVPKSIPTKPVGKTPPFAPRASKPPRAASRPYAYPLKGTLSFTEPQGPRPEQLQQLKQATRTRRWGKTFPLIVCGISAFGLGVYGVQLWLSLENGPDGSKIPIDVSDRFDERADVYDKDVASAEWWMGLKKRRKALTELARGHVLEVAVGTGRNFPYYPTKQCDTVTLLDQSAPMLAIAKRKWKDQQPEYFNRVFFKQQSALDPITPPYGAQDGYDTVLQTMGLCSTPEPVRLLQNLESVTKEDGGRILLLEHGKSHYNWLNDLLDNTAPSHADKHGCWWNKDIGKIVEDSGLEVVDIQRYNFGTTWWVELKPRKSMRKKLEEAKETINEQVASPGPKSAAHRGWWSFLRAYL